MGMPAPASTQTGELFAMSVTTGLLCDPTCRRKLAPITPVAFPLCCKTQHQTMEEPALSPSNPWNWVFLLLDNRSFQAYRMQPMC
jgi:hypothetical protein